MKIIVKNITKNIRENLMKIIMETYHNIKTKTLWQHYESKWET